MHSREIWFYQIAQQRRRSVSYQLPDRTDKVIRPPAMFLVSPRLLLFFVVAVNVAHGANILGLLSGKSKSHFIWNKALINALVEQGHNVTMMSEEPLYEKSPKNFHYIHLPDLNNNFATFNPPPGIGDDILHHLTWNNFKLIPFIYDYFMKTCYETFINVNFEVLLNYPDDFKFDLIVFDFTMGPCTLGFFHKFKYPPLVGITAFNNPPDSIDYVGGHWHQSYIPFYSTTYNTEMNVFGRIHNFVLYFYDYIYRYMVFLPKLDKLVRPYFQTDMPYIADLMPKAELILVNTHPSTHLAQPIGPNVIEVGGLHIKEPKPLPEDIQQFMNASKKGTIYISLGTVVQSESLGIERCRVILEVIRSFPDYNFLWKIPSEYIKESLPENVMTQVWFEQNDVLAHRSIKAFITHGGTLSTEEATYYGVPIVGMPVLVDQYRNMQRSSQIGVGIMVDLLTLTTEKLYQALKAVLENETYKENTMKRSKLFQDRPMKPLETAVWWVEYVIRHKKLEHLRSPVLDLGVLRSESYDIVVLFTILLILLVWSFYRVISKLCGFFQRSYKESKKLKAH